WTCRRWMSRSCPSCRPPSRWTACRETDGARPRGIRTQSRCGMPVICGIHPVKEALATGEVERLLVAEGKHHPRIHELVTAARGRGIEVRAVPRAVLDRH